METIKITTEKDHYKIEAESYQAYVFEDLRQFDADHYFIHRSHNGKDYTIKAYGANFGLNEDQLMKDVVQTKLNEGWEQFVEEILE